MNKLNLGCGLDYKEGWWNWDMIEEIKTDACFDFTKENFPTSDEMVDEIFCAGVLEQILENSSLVHVLNECHRVLKPTGAITIVVPDAKTSTAFRDPHDVRQFTEATFKYFTAGEKEYERYGKSYGYLPWTVQSIFSSPAGVIMAVLQKANATQTNRSNR